MMSILSKPFQLFDYYFLSEKIAGSTLSNLTFSIDAKSSLNKLKNHKFSRNELLHYGSLTSVFLFVFFVLPASILYKLPVVALFLVLLTLPLTSQFFVPALPVFAWLALFFSVGKIPATWKPPISVKVLPAMETIFYGDNLSAVLATYNVALLDILAWIPYGLLHFALPFIVAALIFIFGPPTSLRSYGFAFGYMNLIGVLTQIFFPAAPPWYMISHGLDPANYSMSGSPGGLARIDAILGFDMYTSNFSNAPVPFGAFPSLHSGIVTMEALFMSWLFPKLSVVWWGYVCWLWWSTMYLTHHYFIDLMAGAGLSFLVFTYTKYQHLPVNEAAKFCRWSYTVISKLEIVDPLSTTYSYSDLESAVPSNPAYLNTDFEMNIMSRSRQSSRVMGYPPVIDSPDVSASPSVFEEPRLTSSSSVTSLDELDASGSNKL